MEYSKLYNFLINNADKLYTEKTEEELYELGKKLPLVERINYDYKIKSLKENFEFCEYYSEYYNLNNMIISLINNNELDYIINNFEKILSYDFQSKNLLLDYLKENINSINKDDLDKMNYLISYYMLEMRYELEEKDINIFKNSIDNIIKNEELTIFDIRKIGYGSYSKIYKAGDKIIKISQRRDIKEIIDNNKILLPDKFIKIKSNTIEITDYIDSNNDFTKDEIYEVYKELREQGIVWLDPTKQNLKRIDEKNIKRQQEKSKNRDKYPFVKNKRFINRPLKVNEPVIIDLDHLVDERDKGRIIMINDYLREDILIDREKYEKRYLLEKKKTID